MDMTRPSSDHDQADDPIKIQHPEEEEHHESRASKMFGKVKARAKKFKNSLTKHGNEHDHDVVEEEDENDEPEPEKNVAPVNEVSAMGRTSQPESLSHPRETNVPAPEEIVSSATKDSTAMYSSDDNKRVEPEPLRDATFEHEADVSDREDSRETHHVPLNTPVSLISPTEDVSTPGEDEFLGGQQEGNNETPKILENDVSGESTYQTKIPYHTQQGSGEDGLEKTDESPDQSGLGTELESSGIGKDYPVRFGGESKTELGKDLPSRSFGFDQKTKSGLDNGPETEPREDNPAKSHEFDQTIESGDGNDSPTRFGGKSETLMRDDFPVKSHDLDMPIKSRTGDNSPTRVGGKPGTGPREDFSENSHDLEQKIEPVINTGSLTGFDEKPENQKIESETGEDLPTRFGGKLGTGPREYFPEKSHEFEQKIESIIAIDSPTGIGGEPKTLLRDDFPAKGNDFDQKTESGTIHNSPTRFDGKQGTQQREDFQERSHDTDQKIDSDIGNDSPMSFGGKPELLPRDDFTAKSHEFDLKIKSGSCDDSPTRFSEKRGTGPREDFPTKSHEFDQKIETILGIDSPTEFDRKSETLPKDDLLGKSHDFESGTGDDFPSRDGGKPGTGPREDFPMKSHELDQKIESIIGIDSPTGFGEKPKTLPMDDFSAHEIDPKIESGAVDDSPSGFGGKPGTRLRDDFPEKSQDFDQKIESRIYSDSPSGFGGNPETLPRNDFPTKSQDFDLKIESGTRDASSTRSGRKPEIVQREDFPEKSHEFEQTIKSEIGKDTGDEKPGTEGREYFLGKNSEFDQEIESAVGKKSPTRLGGESGLERNLPARSDDVKVETGLGKDLPTGTNDKLSPKFSGQNERNDFDSTQEPKPSTYTEMIGSATSFVTNTAMATKNAITSSHGNSGETADGQHKSPVGVEKLTTDEEHVKETVPPVTKKLPLSVGGNGAEETQQGEDKGVSTRDHLAEKLTPEEEEDETFSGMVAGKLNLGGGEKKTTAKNEVEVAMEKIPSDKLPKEIEHGEEVAEEGKGGGMVGKIKGAYNYWLGGTTEEVKPKSPVSVEETSQSLGSTVGTKGFSDSGESGLGETDGSTGVVPLHRGL